MRENFCSRLILISILKKAGLYDKYSFPAYAEYARQVIEKYGNKSFLEHTIAANLFIFSHLMQRVSRTGKLPHKQDLFAKNLKKDLQSYVQLKIKFEKASGLQTTKDLDNLKIQKHHPKPLDFKFLEKILDFASFILPKKIREEFIGDIKETRQEMQRKGYSKWSVNGISCFKVCSVILGALRMRLSDLFELENENNK